MIVRLGLTPGLAGTADAVADQQVRVAEGAVAGVDDAALGSAPITAPPRMWAVVGMLRVDSVSAALRECRRCAWRTSGPPARRRGCRSGWAASGPARSGGARPARAAGGCARSRIAVSSDCITSRITVRCDHLPGQSRRSGLQRVADHRRDPLERPGDPGPGPGHGREQAAHRVAGAPVGDDLDVGVGIGVDARGDRHRAGEVAAVVGSGDRLDRLRVGAHQLPEPLREPRQGPAVLAVGEQLVRAQRPGGDHDAARPSGCARDVAARPRGARWSTA